jgi:hypothetical protein
MPLRQKQTSAAVVAQEFTASEAQVLLGKLEELGHVTPAHIRAAREAVAHEIKTIVEHLNRLKDLIHVPRARASEPPAPVRTVQPKPRAAAVTPERRKTMELQGRYLGLMHKVPKSELAKFKAMIAKVGKEEVVRRMETYVRKHGSPQAGAGERRSVTKSRSRRHTKK